MSTPQPRDRAGTVGMDCIDLFSGLGGFSLGAEQAGARVLYAVNHWQVAVECHARNHPETVHAVEDVERVNWLDVPAHNLLLASPACQGHARARGRERPHHDAQRATAWAVVHAAEVHKPACIIVENVPEFAKWLLYPAWTDALARLGYSVSPHVIDAADVGVPQHRRRLFVICTRSRSPLLLALPRLDHVPARSIIDLDGGTWTQVDRPGRATATLARITNGRAEFGSEFALAYYSSERSGRSLDRPLGTVRTRAAHAVVVGDRMRMLTVDEVRRAMGFPDGYQLPEQKAVALHLLGNAVVPEVARRVVEAVRRAV